MADRFAKLSGSNPFGDRPALNLDDLTGGMVEEQPQIVERIVEVEKVVEVIPENALIPHDNGAMVYKRFVMLPTALSIPEDTTQEEWADFGLIIKQLDTTISWVVGEWAEFANKKWGFTYEQIAVHFGYEVSTLMTYTSIVRKVSALIRNQGLSFAHHRLVANLPEIQQDMWLTKAAQSGWNVAEMREAMHPKKEDNQHAITVRKLRKRVRQFADEIEDVIGDFDADERHEIAQMLMKLAKKIDK